MNEPKPQNIEFIITTDIECCVVNVSSTYSKYVIAEHMPISVGYICKIISNRTLVWTVSNDLLVIF